MNHRQAYDKNNGPIFVQTAQGGKRVGELKNNVLHMERDYETHHYRKIPGWAFDKDMFDKNKDRIHAFVLHCRNYPLDSKKVDVILTLDLAMEGLDNTNMKTIDWGHNQQYLVPDRHWKLTVSSQMPNERKPVELKPSPPSDVHLHDLLHRPLTPSDLPAPDFVLDGSTANGFDYPKPGYVEEPKVEFKPIFELQSTQGLITFNTAKGLVDAGHRVYIARYAQGLYLAKDGNTYMMKSSSDAALPGLVFVYQPWMDETPIFKLTP